MRQLTQFQWTVVSFLAVSAIASAAAALAGELQILSYTAGFALATVFTHYLLGYRYD